MELNQFISEALRGVQSGIEGARDKSDYYLDVTTSKGIHFDLAVTTVSKKGAEGGGKIKVLSFAEAGGSKGSAHEQTITNRLQFNVKAPVDQVQRSDFKRIEKRKA